MFSKKYYSPEGDNAGGENTGTENEAAGTETKTEADEIADLEAEAAENKDNADDDSEKEPQAMSEDNKFKSIEDLEKEEAEAEGDGKDKDADDKKDGKEKDKKNQQAEADKAAKPGEKKTPEKKENASGDESTEPTFKIKDDAKADAAAEEETNWQSLGKELGLEVKEDDYESFKSSFEEKLKQAPSVNEDEVFNKKIESFDPEAKELFQFLQNKGKLQDFINPIRQYDEILALSDEDIVRKQLKLNKWDDDKINSKIQLLKEEAKLEDEAYGLRKQVETARDNRKSQIIAKQQQVAAADKDKETTKRNKEDATLVEHINKVEKFMGGVLPKEERAKVAKRIQSGYYREKFANDPQFVVDAILAYELKDQMIETASGKSFTAGRHQNQDKLHNLKQINTAETGGRSTKQIKPAGGDGHFNEWKTAMED